MRIIAVSGLSGAGKTIALQTLEDLNYYCVDNLPLKLLQPFAQEILAREDALFHNTAVGIDVRNFLDELDSFPTAVSRIAPHRIDRGNLVSASSRCDAVETLQRYPSQTPVE
ncbi:MAG: hypothetical protein HC808_15810 [Candidatus Competibacteraceae bacterium]|nr:hypothetical protein [Candidatus Competibacteraceae bacterium]